MALKSRKTHIERCPTPSSMFASPCAPDRATWRKTRVLQPLRRIIALAQIEGSAGAAPRPFSWVHRTIPRRRSPQRPPRNRAPLARRTTAARQVQHRSPCPRRGNGQTLPQQNRVHRVTCGTCGPFVGRAANLNSRSPSRISSADRPGVRGKASAAASDNWWRCVVHGDLPSRRRMSTMCGPIAARSRADRRLKSRKRTQGDG